MLNRGYSAEILYDSSMDRKKEKRALHSHSSNSMDTTDMSQNSVFCDMRRFGSAVQNMEATILVPSRLMDMDLKAAVVGDAPLRRLPILLRSGDAYDVFHMLRSVREQLCGGLRQPAEDTLDRTRLPRSVSTISWQSLGSELSEESCEEAPQTSPEAAGGRTPSCSGIGDEDSGLDEEDASVKLRHCFTRHLDGLTKCMAQMTEAAEFLCASYERQLNATI